MRPTLLNTITGQESLARIEEIFRKEIPLKKDGWNFNWRKLHKTEGGKLYKITLVNSPQKIQGVVMISFFNEEMVFMNNVEVAPGNLGKNKLYDNVAGCLISFACLLSFQIGKGDYNGFLSFESKTELIDLYEDKYGATFAMGNKMFIEPQTAKRLIQQYLKIEI
jgi:hypothetical protein